MKIKKGLSVLLVILTIALHMFTFVFASTGSGEFSAYLDNFQKKVDVATGVKDNNLTYAKLKVVSGNVNYVYFNVKNNSGTYLISDWYCVPNDNILYKAYYESGMQPKSGTALTLTAFQKNIVGKTAQGKYVF